MSRRVFVSLLLLLAIAPLFGLLSNAPTTQGQAFTTITAYTARPTTITSLRVSIIPITGTTTFTRSYATTSGLTPPKTLISETVRVGIPGPKYGCNYASRGFAAKKGQLVSVSLESDNEITLFVLTEKDYNIWVQKGKCIPEDFSFLQGGFFITSYDEQLLMENDGSYRFLFLNYGPHTAAIKLKAEIVGVTYETASVVISQVVSLRYSTDTLTVTTIATGTVVRTEQVGLQLDQNSTVIIAVIVVAAVAVVAVVVLRRRGPGKPVAVAPMAPPVESQFVAKRFCISCGAELPVGVNFCNKCGSKQ